MLELLTFLCFIGGLLFTAHLAYEHGTNYTDKQYQLLKNHTAFLRQELHDLKRETAKFAEFVKIAAPMIGLEEDSKVFMPGVSQYGGDEEQTQARGGSREMELDELLESDYDSWDEFGMSERVNRARDDIRRVEPTNQVHPRGVRALRSGAEVVQGLNEV
jgi:hypothetical protein